MGHYLKESGFYQDVLLSKVLHFVRSVGLLWGSAGGGAQEVSDGRGGGTG